MSTKFSDFAAASNTLVNGSNQVVTPHLFTQPVTVTTNFTSCNVCASTALGVRTTAPTTQLDIENGRIRTSLSNVTIDNSTVIYGYNAQLIGSYTAIGEHTGICFAQSSTPLNVSNSTITPGAAITHNRTGAGNYRGDLFFKTQGGLYTCNALTTVMAITSTARVGVGISNPAYPLDVVGNLNCDSIVQVNTSNTIRVGVVNNNTALIEKQYNATNDRYGAQYMPSTGAMELYAGAPETTTSVALSFATNSNAYDSRLTIDKNSSNTCFNPTGDGSLVVGASVIGANGGQTFQVGANAASTTGATTLFNTYATSNSGDADGYTVPGVMFRQSDQYTFIHGNRIAIQGGNNSMYKLTTDTIGNVGNIEAQDRSNNALTLNLNKAKGGLVYVGSNMWSGSNTIVSGRIGVGTATPAYQLQLSTDSAAKPGAGGLWTVASDQRIKENIQVADYGTCYSNLKSLDLKRYSYSQAFKEAAQIQDTFRLGWIAQDVQPIFPKAIHEVDAPEYGLSNMLNVDFDQVYAMMYGALRHAMSTVDQLKNRVAALQAL
jgi:hypothetical protein